MYNELEHESWERTQMELLEMKILNNYWNERLTD